MTASPCAHYALRPAHTCEGVAPHSLLARFCRTAGAVCFCRRLIPVVVPANINPLPAVIVGHLSPAGVIRGVVVNGTPKAEREEVAIVEPVVEVVMVPVVVGPVSASSPHWSVDRCPVVERRPIRHRTGSIKSSHPTRTGPKGCVHCAWPRSSDWPMSHAHPAHGRSMSALPLKADIAVAKSALCQKRTSATHSITWSASVVILGGIVRPRAFAAFKLMIKSNFTGCWTGRFAGLSPRRILST
jgi:hypothetical protein